MFLRVLFEKYPIGRDGLGCEDIMISVGCVKCTVLSIWKEDLCVHVSLSKEVPNLF